MNDSRWMPFLYNSSGCLFEVVTSTTPWDMSDSISLAGI
jgi:hypothetical protein